MKQIYLQWSSVDKQINQSDSEMKGYIFYKIEIWEFQDWPVYQHLPTPGLETIQLILLMGAHWNLKVKISVPFQICIGNTIPIWTTQYQC